jgi:predicted RNase H-like HicB family nuclease
LPTTATFSLCERSDGKFLAHALEFDLVSVADTEKEAEQKLRLAVQLYIEYGLYKGWGKDIRFPAPKEYWDRLTVDSCIAIGPPIEIRDHRPERLIVYRASKQRAATPTPSRVAEALCQAS